MATAMENCANAVALFLRSRLTSILNEEKSGQYLLFKKVIDIESCAVQGAEIRIEEIERWVKVKCE